MIDVETFWTLIKCVCSITDGKIKKHHECHQKNGAYDPYFFNLEKERMLVISCRLYQTVPAS
jgi:hypothetical protein